MSILILWVGRPGRAVLLYCHGNLACFPAASLNSTNLLVHCPLCTIVSGSPLRDSLFRQAAESFEGANKNGRCVQALGRTAGGPASGVGRYQGAAPRETAESRPSDVPTPHPSWLGAANL